uniref:Uncharacterized protein n=1 Tax=Parascaris univalens TaxID=6257 RepID=A0A915B214_PARUN
MTSMFLIGLVVNAVLISSNEDRQNIEERRAERAAVGEEEEAMNLLSGRKEEPEASLRCPLDGTWFTATTNSTCCIYALGICGRKYFKELIVNDADFKSKTCDEIELADLNLSAMHPCDDRNLTVRAYGGGLMRYKNVSSPICRGSKFAVVRAHA